MNFHPKIAVLVIVNAIALLSAATQAADTYKIDPTHTSVVFSVGHGGLSYVYGFFRQAGGAYILDRADPARSRFQFIIQSNSLDTNHAKRDDHLRGPDFFNVQQFPTIKFDSTRVVLTNRQDRVPEYQVTGNLTLHGVTREITLPLRMLAERPGPYGDPRTGFLCQVSLKRSDFDMTTSLENDVVGDAVSITISFEGELQDANVAQQRTR
jgi:polyisoprenoid-binding protein YceI